MAKDSTGNSGRIMLADITNAPRKTSILSQERYQVLTKYNYREKAPKGKCRTREGKSRTCEVLSRKRIIIESSGAELDKLRITLQKTQLE